MRQADAVKQEISCSCILHKKQKQGRVAPKHHSPRDERCCDENLFGFQRGAGLEFKRFVSNSITTT
jgi:hypothetical protein